jgi:hypothetical protein
VRLKPRGKVTAGWPGTKSFTRRNLGVQCRRARGLRHGYPGSGKRTRRIWEKDGFLRLHGAASYQARHLGPDEGLATNGIAKQAVQCGEDSFAMSAAGLSGVMNVARCKRLHHKVRIFCLLEAATEDVKLGPTDGQTLYSTGSRAEGFVREFVDNSSGSRRSVSV